MVRLATLKPRIAVDRTQRVQSVKVSDTRITGWKLQSRRKRLWSANPCCAICGRLTEYPHGFELDHKVALHLGGSDNDENCQILCCGHDGCHRKKTAADMKN